MHRHAVKVGVTPSALAHTLMLGMCVPPPMQVPTADISLVVGLMDILWSLMGDLREDKSQVRGGGRGGGGGDK